MGNFKLVIFLLAITFVNLNGLHLDGVEPEINALFRTKDYRKYYKENVVNVTSWNLDKFDQRYMNHVCTYAKKIKPKVC